MSTVSCVPAPALTRVDAADECQQFICRIVLPPDHHAAQPGYSPGRAYRPGLRERRESETGYADLKTYLRGRQQILRSKNPAGVAQELYALLIVYQLVQLARIRAAGNRPGQQPCDPDRISFTVVLRALIRSIGKPSSQRLLHDVLDEIWSQPLLTRRPRSKPRERKGTAAFGKACEQHPPYTVTYKLTMGQPTRPEHRLTHRRWDLP